MSDFALLIVIFVGTLAVASVLRLGLRPEPGGKRPGLDARGLLLFVPVLTLLFSGAARDVLVPMQGALAIYLLCAIGEALGTSRLVRIVVVIGTGLVVHHAGVSIETVTLPMTDLYWDLGWLSPVLTVVWLWACSSLFGRAGSIPNVAYGMAGLSGLTFYLVCMMVPWATGESARWLALAVAGVSLAQLPSIGQTAPRSAVPSSYAMGFLIGCLAILGALKHTAALAALLPILVISVPLFGATYTYAAALRGRARGMHIGQRRQHLHELLLEQGYTPGQVFGVLMGVSAYTCMLGLGLVALIGQPAWLKLAVLVVGMTSGPFIFFVVMRMIAHGPPRPVTDETPAIDLFNVRLHPVTMDEALARAEQFIREGGPHMIVTSDTSAVVRAQDDEELRTIINEADLATVDGQGVVVCARLLNLPIAQRVAGVDMMQRLCEIAARLSQPVALLGAAPGVAEQAGRNLQEACPGLDIVYIHDGYFAEDEDAQIVADIRAARPMVLFVAMGIPKQEKWIKAHMEELNVAVSMGVGGSLDVLAGRVQRAPAWMRGCGLEWLYRTLREPRRLPRLAALPRMLMMTLHELATSPDPAMGLMDQPAVRGDDRP